MAELLQPSSFDEINIVELSRLTADAAAAQAVVAIENADQFATDVYAVVGNLGAENAELKKVLSVSGLNVTFTTNLERKHYNNEPITILYGNQIKIYRAANVDGSVPDDADFDAVGSPIDIQADQSYVEYSDATGGSDYWYKKSYYNSTTDAETDLAAAVAIRGGNYGHYTTVDAVRDEAGLNNNRYISNSKIYDKLIEAESEVNGSLAIVGYGLPLDSIPADVVNATKLLAAGYLLTKSYGPEHEGTSKDGERKIKMARDILKRIESGETTLVTSGGAAVVQETGVSGYPDDTAELATPAEAPMFKVTDRL